MRSMMMSRKKLEIHSMQGVFLAPHSLQELALRGADAGQRKKSVLRDVPSAPNDGCPQKLGRQRRKPLDRPAFQVKGPRAQ